MSRKVVASKRVGLDLTGKLVTIQSHKIRSQILWPIRRRRGISQIQLKSRDQKNDQDWPPKLENRCVPVVQRKNTINLIVYVSRLQIVCGGRRGGRECKIANLQMESLRILPPTLPRGSFTSFKWKFPPATNATRPGALFLKLKI